MTEPSHVDREDGITYSYFEETLRFTDARAACDEANSHLAYIQTLLAKERIFGYLKTQGESYWWIGLTSTNGTWRWLNGEKLNKSVIEMAQEERGTGCGTLYQPIQGHNPTMYDYPCERHKRSYICESHLQSLSNSNTSPALGPGIIAAISLLVALVAVTAILFTIRKVRGKVTRESFLNSSATLGPEERVSKKNRQSSKRRDDDVNYATIEHDAGYATIDTVVYSEVIDEAYFSAGTVGSENGRSLPANDVAYSQVSKGRKSRPTPASTQEHDM